MIIHIQTVILTALKSSSNKITVHIQTACASAARGGSSLFLLNHHDRASGISTYPPRLSSLLVGSLHVQACDKIVRDCSLVDLKSAAIFGGLELVVMESTAEAWDFDKPLGGVSVLFLLGPWFDDG